MKLVALMDRFDQSPVLMETVEELNRSRHVKIGAMVASAQPALAAYARRQIGGSLIFVASHPHRAESLVQELAPWLDMPVLLFPAFDSLPYERAPAAKEILSRRQSIVNRLQEETMAVVTSIRALLQSVSLPSTKAAKLELRSDLTVQPESLLSSLIASGYEAAPLVEEEGTFVRRGGIVDVFPIGASHPVRLELLGNSIDSLRVFDPVSQRSLDRIDSIAIPPMTNFDAAEIETIAAELEALSTENLLPEALDRWTDDLEQLGRGKIEDPEFLAPYLNGETSLLKAADRHARQSEALPLLVLEDADEVHIVASDVGKQAAEVQDELVASGALPAGMRPGLLSFAKLEQSFPSLALMEFAPGGSEQDVETRVFARPPAYGGRIREFLHSLDPVRQEARAYGDMVITSYQHGRLAELLTNENVPVRVVDEVTLPFEPGTVTIVKGSLAEGWIAPSLDLEVYTDHEIFGWQKPRAAPRRKRAPRDTFFTEFTPGDYVVHIEHGIGRLVGTTKMRDAGIEREYLIVEYAGTDRLYVPTDQLDRLTRYVGMGDAAPHLNRLGGTEWTRAKARAKQAAEDIAEDLIALYAQREAQGGHAFLSDSPWQQELESAFPFEETPDQARAILDVKDDMEQTRPMDRLVVADVGYGKTEVAVRAAFKAVIDGMQVAVLVPTTILAQQHLDTFHERLEAFPVTMELLSRFRSPKEQKDVLNRLAAGEVDIVIGTHRLLGKDIKFNNLGLLVVDEEQRFGVRHKERLKQLRSEVDVLTLTATPIPRTLHMSLTGIRDVSIIQTPPEGRLPIKTYLQPFEDRLVREALIRELERDGQVFYVHNRVAGIEAVAQKLRRLVPEARIVVGHGQMPEDQLEKVMQAFLHHEADVLLSSTIIESGLDIPNVNTIVLDHAESLGLAQMYQLRGRVGRGVNQAYAYLLYPRDARIGKDAMRRMEAVFEATELGAGFRIAMSDLEIRGAGNLLGAEQSGNVAAIGFDLYTNLLSEAIERMRGQPAVDRTQVTVDLPFDVLIPETYVPDERERLALYRRLATLADLEGIAGMSEELRDRFGPIPEAVTNLLSQMEVKFLAERAHVVSLVLRGDLLTVKGEKRILYDRLALYKRFAMDARIDENILRIEASALQPDWLQKIKGILEETAAIRDRQAEAVVETAPVP